jgi:hypothetical protein
MLFYISTIESNRHSQLEVTLCYLFEQLMNAGLLTHEEITSKLMKENQHIIALIEDVEMLEEIESKLRREEVMEEFTN